MSARIYKNTKRVGSKGTQSETPSLAAIDSETFKVGGYQRFQISNKKVVPTGGYKGKFEFIRKFLHDHGKDCNSVSDIGSSTGLVAFTAFHAGYSSIYALDHDTECVKVVSELCKKLGITAVVPKEYSFGGPHTVTDIVIVAALIHWIYSCTALYGNFDQIMSYLKKITGKYMLIEWVHPHDPAIKAFHHTSFNTNIIKEPYTLGNFLASARRHFKSVEKVFAVNATREIYLCEAIQVIKL